jgi:hypothetical protein
MLVRQATLPHQRVCNWDLQCFGELLQFFRRTPGQHAATGVEHRPSRGRQRIDDACGGGRIET